MSLVDPDRESNRESRVEGTRGEQKSAQGLTIALSELTTSFAPTTQEFQPQGISVNAVTSPTANVRIARAFGTFFKFSCLNFPKANPRPFQVFFMF